MSRPRQVHHGAIPAKNSERLITGDWLVLWQKQHESGRISRLEAVWAAAVMNSPRSICHDMWAATTVADIASHCRGIERPRACFVLLLDPLGQLVDFGGAECLVASQSG
jgi:hypothetical protein